MTHLLRVGRLEQALHRLDLVSRLRVLLRGEVVVALPLEHLGHLEQDGIGVGRHLAENLGLLRAHLLGELLRQRQRVHYAEVERLGVLARLCKEAHGLLVLAVVQEELGARLEERRVGVRRQMLGDLAQLVEEAAAEAQLDRLGRLARLLVEADRAVLLAARLKVRGGLGHLLGRRVDRHHVELAGHVVRAREADGVVEARGALVVLDGLLDVVLGLVPV